VSESLGVSPLIITIGTEFPPAESFYVGVVSDEQLNMWYNATECVLLPSKFEGIGLAMIEALMAEKLPIVWSDNPTAHEFVPPELICDENNFLDIIKVWLSKSGEEYDKMKQTVCELGATYRSMFNKRVIAKNIEYLIVSR
jgi:glycosyltransferase involved in cell wall biosynthesis